MTPKSSIQISNKISNKIKRLSWVDNLRATIVILVVNFHSCITYSHVGDWYLKDGPEGTLEEKLPYIFWIFHLQSFFMGLLFFIAGAMAAGAIQRHGPWKFMEERLFRLGVPALLYMLFLHPFMVFELMDGKSWHPNLSDASIYTHYITSGQVWSGSGPLWFVLALLAFCIAYAVIRMVALTNSFVKINKPPTTQQLLAFMVTLSLITAVTRGFFPIGTSILNFQLCYFPQYISMFTIGIISARKGWLNELAESKIAKQAGLSALIGGPLLLGIIFLIGGGPAEGPTPGEHGPILYFGGWNLHAFAAAIWEQFTGVGLALGMIALFKKKLDFDTKIFRWISSRSFAVYVFHAPILVWLTIQFHVIPLGQFSKILLLTVTGLILSFMLAEILKRSWGIRRLF